MSNYRIYMHKTGAGLLVGAMLLLSACQSDFVIDANLPKVPDELVVNSLFQPDSLFEVFLNTSKPLLSREKVDAVINAKVEILQGGVVVDELVYDPNKAASSFLFFGGSSEDGERIASYRSSTLFPEVGQEYSIRVSADGFDDVTGSGNVPAPVEIDEVILTSNVFDDPDLGPRSEIRIRFKDPKGTNFYNLQYHHRTLSVENEQWFSYSTGFRVLTPLQDDLFGADPNELIQGGSPGQAGDGGVSFSDVFFEGEEKEIVIEVSGRNCGGSTDARCEHVVELSTVTEAFYNYHRTAELQFVASENPFAEPVRVRSNMSNDMGIFAGVNTSIWVEVQD